MTETKTFTGATRPYDPDRLLSYEQVMDTIPPVFVRTADLLPTQPVLMVDRLLAMFAGARTEGPDPHPHVVQMPDGRLYIHNGHHRWALALLGYQTLIAVRVQAGTEGVDA